MVATISGLGGGGCVSRCLDGSLAGDGGGLKVGLDGIALLKMMMRRRYYRQT